MCRIVESLEEGVVDDGNEGIAVIVGSVGNQAGSISRLGDHVVEGGRGDGRGGSVGGLAVVESGGGPRGKG